MPVYNEATTLSAVVKRALDVRYPCDVEPVLVDDGSTDGCVTALDAVTDPRLRVIRQARNQGKGAAVRANGSRVPRRGGAA